MRVLWDVDDLRPIVQQIVGETLRQLESLDAHGERIAYTEPEAAALLGVARHVLRDCRRRGEITASRCGVRNLYERSELIGFLTRSRGEPRYR
jgi:hypothetical protein